MNQKMTFMLLSPTWGRNHEMKRNSEHLAHEPWPRSCGRIVLKLYKKQMKFKNHKICYDIISRGEGKKLRRFCTSYHICSLQIETSPVKIHRVEKESFRFHVKVTVELVFGTKLFVYEIDNFDWFIPNFGYFWEPFCNVNFFQLKNIMWHKLNLYRIKLSANGLLYTGGPSLLQEVETSEHLHVCRRSALTVRSPRVDRPLFNMFGHPNILKVGRSIRGILATEKGEERNKKNKNRFVVCQVSRHTTNDQNLSCALDLAHDKMKFKFCKRSWMVK